MLGAVGIGLLSSVGGFLFGLDIGYIGPILNFKGFKDSINEGADLTPHEQGFVVGIFSLGAVTTSLPCVAPRFIDGIGRRDSTVFGAGAFCLGAVLQAASQGLGLMIAGRLVAGIAVGLLSNSVPLYQSEVAAREWRGALVSTYQLAITAGILVAFWIDHVVNHQNDGGWRLAIGVQLVPGMILGLGMLAMPRSPSWLLLVGRDAEAEVALTQIRGAGGTLNSESVLTSVVATELAEIQRQLTKEGCRDAGGGNWSALLSSGCYMRRLVCLGMLILMLQQLCGMNAFMYYGTDIFGMLGYNPTAFNAVSGLVNFFATFIGLWAVDRSGRRTLLFASAAIGMLISCLLCGALGALFPSVMAVSIFLFISSFAWGWGPAAWVYVSEMFPLKYRSAGMSFTTCAVWIGNYLIAHLTPLMLERLYFNTFFVFSGFCLIAALLAVWLPETRGVSLEDIAILLEPKLGAKRPSASSAEITEAQPLVADFGKKPSYHSKHEA